MKRHSSARSLPDRGSESQARFLAASLSMLAEYHLKHPLATLTADGPLLALDRNGLLVVPAPVDYLYTYCFVKSPLP